jgi:hypothetical protein
MKEQHRKRGSMSNMKQELKVRIYQRFQELAENDLCW